MTPEKLKDWRQKLSYTQSELAEALGVTKTSVYRWEAGLRQIPSFLYLALKYLELKGGESKTKGKRMKKERKVKRDGHNLQARPDILG